MRSAKHAAGSSTSAQASAVGREEQVHHHVELHLLQRRQDALGLGAHAGDGVVLHHEHGLDGVGLARLHGLEQGVGADAVHGLEGLVAAVVLALGMGDGLGALVPHRAARRPGDRHAEGGVGGEHAARVLEVAGERHEVEARHAGDEALGGVVHGHAPLQAARLRAPDLAGRLHDEVLGHAAGLGGEARRGTASRARRTRRSRSTSSSTNSWS